MIRLFKCKNLPALGFGWVLACLLAFPAVTQAKETLFWLVRDLPPLMTFEGPQKGQGVTDRLLSLLIAGMPEYQHDIVRVNRARGMQMLLEPSFTCDPSLLWNQERAKRLIYSIPAYRVLSNGVVIRHQDRAALMPFVIDGKVDLAALLALKEKKLGVVAERSYGQFVDGLLQRTPGDALSSHYGNDALGSLLQMQRLGRLTAVLGYWPEIRYQASLQGISPEELEFYAIRGVNKYQSIHVACSDTAQGRQAMIQIDQILHKLRQNQLIEVYAYWLDPETRSEYLEDARAFFQHGEP